MAVPFPKFSWWLWSGSSKEKNEAISNNSSTNLNSMSSSSSSSSSDWDCGFREPEKTLKFPTRIASTERQGKEKWRIDEERRNLDHGIDIVAVSSEGLCSSGCESDGPDWSIGWEEPHGPGFIEDNEIETDGGFAVLVPCYRPGCKELAEGSKGKLLTDGNKSVQQWFSSLQNF